MKVDPVMLKILHREPITERDLWPYADTANMSVGEAERATLKGVLAAQQQFSDQVETHWAAQRARRWKFFRKSLLYTCWLWIPVMIIIAIVAFLNLANTAITHPR
jgi:hypothetical protein